MKKLNFLLLVLITITVGCAFAHTSDYHLVGKNLKTPYGMGDVDLHIIGNTTIGGTNGR